jgi:hypothetical protein
MTDQPELPKGVTDGGPWRGPSLEEWVERIARGSTPVREYVDGKFQPWIETPELALRRAG